MYCSGARALFNRHVDRLDQSTLRGRAYLDDEIAVYVAVHEPLDITVVVAQTGRSLFASQADWTKWQQYPERFTQNLHKKEHRFLTLVLPRVWALIPTRQSFISRTDWTGTERHLYADT